MRLRELGTTQSLVFFAPPEVHQSIIDVCKQSNYSINPFQINSSHVVCWLLEQTCRANEQLLNLYLAQGTDYCLRTDAQWRFNKFSVEQQDRESFLKVVRQPERQSLADLYGEVKESQPASSADMASTKLKEFMEELAVQRRNMSSSGDRVHSSMLEEVEQEREVEFQIEQVRQVQKPPTYKALTFPGLQSALRIFVDTGILSKGPWIEHAFDALARTTIGKKYDVQSSASRLYVSSEFMRTVKFVKRQPPDNFFVSIQDFPVS
jgi:hypothetical protein